MNDDRCLVLSVSHSKLSCSQPTLRFPTNRHRAYYANPILYNKHLRTLSSDSERKDSRLLLALPNFTAAYNRLNKDH